MSQNLDFLILVYISWYFWRKSKLNSSCREIYFLGDVNINLFESEKHVFDKSSSNDKNLDPFTKTYQECCTLFGFKQLIKCPTHVTCSSSSILDHVPAIFPNRHSKSGVIDVGEKLQKLKATTINKLLSILLKIIHLRTMKKLWEI